MEMIISDKTKKGTVKFYDNEKGFGFIKSEGTEIFVHSTGLIDKIEQKDQVIFILKQGKRGLNATEVKVVK